MGINQSHIKIILLKRTSEVKLKSKIWIVFIILLISILGSITNGSEVHYKTKRVPAEWEPQEAIWMQWPGYWEKDYEITFAKMANTVQYFSYDVRIIFL